MTFQKEHLLSITTKYALEKMTNKIILLTFFKNKSTLNNLIFYFYKAKIIHWWNTEI